MTRSFAATAGALGAQQFALSQPPFPVGQRLFFELRRYSLITGPQMMKLTEAYVADALLPALGRLGIGPVGAFKLDFGAETPALNLLLPSPSLDTLVNAGARLAGDETFVKAAAPFNAVSTSAPAFHRVDSQLLHAFQGYPTVHLPAAGKAKRIFQMRTYESPTPAAHERKLEMFHSGEFEIFKNTGLEAVFFGDTVIGPRMPSLTYMLTFKDMAQLDTNWNAFRADPAWKKLSADPRFATDTLVSNISNLILSPTSYSQI